jgi:hypothetical protein
MASDHSGAIDFGGGDTDLVTLALELPGLAEVMTEAALYPVLLVFLSPRVVDLTVLKALDAVGFQPPCTALVMNLGRAEHVMDFDPVRVHSVYKAAVARGAAEIFMPRLHEVGPIIEQRRMSFAKATSDGAGMTVLDRIRVRAWLDEMADAFEPVASWLP